MQYPAVLDHDRISWSFLAKRTNTKGPGMSFSLALKESLIHKLSSHRHSPLVTALARCGGALVKGAGNYSFNHDLNGESRVLKVLATHVPAAATVFDVGANVGDWTELALRHMPQASVHSFEIAPPTFAKLRGRFDLDPRIHLNGFGLSDANSEIDLNYATGHDGHSSMVAPFIPGRYDTIKALVRRGDDYVEANGLTKPNAIALLKIDVEGDEEHVLKGFTRTLQAGRVSAIQFEYGRANVQSRFLLKDFYDTLSPLGFKIGKIYPNEVEFQDYALANEDFIGPNYVAVHRDQTALLAALEHRLK